MPGWNLPEGEYSHETLNEESIWEIINIFYSPKSMKTTTYKYCFFKCLLDNLFNFDENLSLGFDSLFTRFTEIYWNLVAKFHICQIQKNSQWQKSGVETIIESFINRFNFCNSDVSFEVLRDDLKLELTRQISLECSKYVIGAFYCDTKKCFFSFSKKNGTIIMNPEVYYYLVKFKRIMEKINYFEWSRFLEKINSNEIIASIPDKLDFSTKRQNLTKYKEYILKEIKQDHCFYCHRYLLSCQIEVDHYIPWSYIKDDKLWNLVLSCRTCNNSKRDKLTTVVYLDDIVIRNKAFIRSSINAFNDDLHGYNMTKIPTIYRSAVFNGYENNWVPKALSSG